MDGLSGAANIVGIAVPALYATRLLLDDINNVVKAPETITSLRQDLESVEKALVALNALPITDFEFLGQEVFDETKPMFDLCTKACEKFRSDLHQWTKHSEDGKLSWLDRVNVGFFKQNRIKSLVGQLQNCKMTVNMVINVTILRSSVQHSHITEEIQKKIVATKEVQVNEAITAIEDSKIRVESRLKDISAADRKQSTSEDVEDKVQAVEGISDEKVALSASQKALRKMLSKTEKRSEVTVTNIFTDNSSKVLAGIINTQGKHGKVEVMIDNVHSKNGGKVIAGIVDGVCLDNF